MTDELLYEGRFLRFVSRDGWEFVERHGAWAVVAIVAITEANELVLVEQYRPPVDRNVIELPAGLVGDHDDDAEETTETAARRELLEETGYEADRWDVLFRGLPSGGLTSEEITVYRATGLRRTGPGGGDASESITVHVVPIDDLETWLRAREREGKGVDAKLYCALHFARDTKTPS